MPPAPQIAHPSFVTQAPRDTAGWLACFKPAALPVLSSTAQTLEELRLVEDAVDARLLAETVGNDPLLTLKLLAHVAALRRASARGRDGGEPETVTAALVMLGITPFFRAFGPQASVDDWLSGQPQALDGFRRVLRRSRRAANFAIGFAVHRMDHDASVIHEAALLHDAAELLLWLHAPTLALEIQSRQEVDPDLRSASVQRQVLGVELIDLQHAVLQAWGLPLLLVDITDDHAAHPSAQMRNVALAIRVARHSTAGWDNPALPDDLREIGQLLQLAPEPTAKLLRDIDDES
jgi:HD-like signal output (HDOD) protein